MLHRVAPIAIGLALVASAPSIASAQYYYNGRVYQGPVRPAPNILPRTYNSTAPYVQRPRYNIQPRIPWGSLGVARTIVRPGPPNPWGTAFGGAFSGATSFPRPVGNECYPTRLPGARC